MRKSLEYWAEQSETDDGIMGGYGHLGTLDVRDSLLFWRRVDDKLGLSKTRSRIRLAELGGGNGRVTINVTSHIAKEIDFFEPVEKMRKVAQTRIGSLDKPPGIRYFDSTLQQFEPAEGEYDVIWIQWCTLYATDDEFVELLLKCKKGLALGGVIILKENTILTTSDDARDMEDESVIRTGKKTESIITKAGLVIQLKHRQRNWPSDVYPVTMYAINFLI